MNAFELLDDDYTENGCRLARVNARRLERLFDPETGIYARVDRVHTSMQRSAVAILVAIVVDVVSRHLP